MTTASLDHELDDGADGARQLEQVVPLLGALVARVRPDPDELVAQVDDFARRVLASCRRDDVSFRAPAAVAADADPVEGLVAFTGRTA